MILISNTTIKDIQLIEDNPSKFENEKEKFPQHSNQPNWKKSIKFIIASEIINNTTETMIGSIFRFPNVVKEKKAPDFLLSI